MKPNFPLSNYGWLFSVIFILFFSGSILAQESDSFWQAQDESRINTVGKRYTIPSKYGTFRLGFDDMNSHLTNPATIDVPLILEIPNPEGEMEAFRVWRNTLMPKNMQRELPEVMAFDAVSVANSSIKAKISINPKGFHAMVINPHGNDYFVDPYDFGNKNDYISFYREDRLAIPGEDPFICHYEGHAIKKTAEASLPKSFAGDCQMRTYRLAVTTTVEYSAFHGNTISSVTAAIVVTMNRVNGVFENDLGITMNLVANNNSLINIGSDNLSNFDGDALLTENQIFTDNTIGSANYDIGHVFSTGGGGVAYLGAPCTNFKAGGVTGQPSPIGDTFDIDFVAHEMGHSFGANHTQNNDCNSDPFSSMEPGSASTIMGYAGICAPDVQSNSDAYFHARSIQQISNNIVSGNSSSCPSISATSNNAPTVNAGTNYNIPRSTPFELTAVASDPDGDPLTYCWEQMDPEEANMPPEANAGQGPAFRSYSPSSNPVRTLPNLTDLVNNNNPTWEVLSSVNRSYKWQVTVRDNNAMVGCTAEAETNITVSSAAGPFLVNSPNTSVTWEAGTTKMVTWDVAGTNSNPINCAEVDILMSTDGGFTYPIVLLTNVMNNGAQQITVPNNQGNNNRIKVICSDNIFFDISNANFSIVAPTVPDYKLEVNPNSVAVCAGSSSTTSIDLTGLAGFNASVNLAVSGLPFGATANFGQNPLSPNTNTILTINTSSTVSPGTYNLVVSGSGGGISHTAELFLIVNSSSLSNVNLSSPSNGGSTPAQTNLNWSAATGAETYQINIATDPSMNNIIETASNLTSTNFLTSALASGNTYYWQVNASNSCSGFASSPIWSFTTLLDYCASNGNNDLQEEWIETINFDNGGLNNNSGFNTGGYADYTNMIWNVMEGSSYNFTLTPGFTSDTFPEYWRIWVDLNLDGDFTDPGELVYDQGATSSTAVSGNITIPTGFAPVSTRMRISMAYDGAVNSCDSFDYGEVEDYTLVINSNCPDADADGVCDADDLCPGSDDNIDNNNNNIPDGCDILSVSFVVFLEGAMQTDGSMRTSLQSSGLIPNAHPYNNATYGHGPEFPTTAPSGVVDWVLVEARSGIPALSGGSAGTTKVEAHVGFLRSDGLIVHPITGGPLEFSNLDVGTNYYFAIRHRNHLDIMSTFAFSTNSSIIYDFSIAQTQAQGIEQLKNYTGSGGNIWTMYAGDYISDGVIQVTDYDEWQDDPSILQTYSRTDGNLDGTVQTTDFDTWLPNKAKLGSIEIQF